ncbi:MAG: deoxyribose-phosphate aldolase [Planctomycetota bacterium]|jgi:deoxyribose-phosphate aldolase
MYTKEQIAQTIDHAVLKPFATDKDIVKNSKMVDKRCVKSFCVRPTDVKLAAEQLKNSDVVVSMVVGFPHGSNRTETKVLETKLGAEDGAVEFDMVMNIGKFLSGDYEFVQNDIASVVEEARKHKAIVKVILETCYLSPEQIEKACKIAESAGADFVKTSTGFGDGPATPEVIDIMVKTVGNTMGVKASGGVRTYETAVGYLKQGCTRLGAASTEAILDGTPSNGTDESY